MTYNDCFTKGLLRKGSVTDEEAKAQIDIANAYISKAQKILESEVFDMSFLASYISIFHSARGLLYSKGYKERSHYCLFEFVKNARITGNPGIWCNTKGIFVLKMLPRKQ
jgi:hypothetical protein